MDRACMLIVNCCYKDFIFLFWFPCLVWLFYTLLTPVLQTWLRVQCGDFWRQSGRWKRILGLGNSESNKESQLISVAMAPEKLKRHSNHSKRANNFKWPLESQSKKLV